MIRFLSRHKKPNFSIKKEFTEVNPFLADVYQQSITKKTSQSLFLSA